MTPHVKATQLVKEFFKINPKYKFGTGDDNYDDAKKYAIFHVSEIISLYRRIYSGVTSIEKNNAYKFWKEVKEEIEIL